ncbi:MAG: GNAT family N-acetyltransferase [Paracoccaceae bacterium]
MLTFRPATSADAADLAVLLDAASRRLVSWRWSTLAIPGQSWFEVGRQRILTLTGNQSHYTNWLIAEVGGVTVGALNAHVVPQEVEETDLSTLDPVFHPLVELEPQTAGTFYIMGAAVFAEVRGLGYGTALLDQATAMARARGLSRLSRITESFNEGARRLYLRYGFRDLDARPFVAFPGADEVGEWTLMVKDI